MGDKYVEISCWKCKVDYCLPTSLYTVAKQNPDISFFCPHGHSAHFPAGETDEDRLRRERDRAIQEQARLAQQVKTIREQRDRAQAVIARHEKTIVRQKKRASAGACPCCNRSFLNMARHMKSKHPDYGKESNA